MPVAITIIMRDVGAPEARGGGRQHHQADGQKRAERLEAADEVQHDEPQEDEMGRRRRRG